MNRRKHRWLAGAIASLLSVVTLAVYAPAAHHEFIELDDPDYVSANDIVQQGLTWPGLWWAFQAGHASNWHPVTWLSHMLDVQIFGLDPGCHHLVNVLLHALNGGLLFLVLLRMTHALWRSAFVAALFALHPLHVESVAWVAERKDVLSGLFFILTLGAYACYTEARRSQDGRAGRWPCWYGVALVLFGLGLMSKPMLVTLPFVLLLLDVWPLQRLQLSRADGQGAEARKVLVEKIPFLLLCLFACLLTVVAQKQGRAVTTFELLPLGDRLENASAAYVKYLGSAFWPTNLAVFYPHPSLGYAATYRWSGWQTAVGAGFLALVSVAAFLRLRREPWLAVGWYWYLGMLVPVIGIVQVGEQGLADRYTYLPLIGIFVACSWMAAELAARSRFAQVAVVVTGVLLLGACAVLARVQLGHWSNGITLFTHASSVTAHNPKVEFSLGQAWLKAGQADQAIVHLRASLADHPAAAETHYIMGMALAKLGRMEEAVEEFQQVLALVPGHENAANTLVELLMRRGAQAMRAGQTNDAAVIFAAALATRPDLVERSIHAGMALGAQRQWDDAISKLTAAVWLAPLHPEARLQLGLMQARCAHLGDAVFQFRRVLDLDPNHSTAAMQLAWILATAPANEIRDGNEALRLAERVIRNTEGKSPEPQLALAAALAETGRFEEAMAAAELARELAERAGQRGLVAQSHQLLACFQSKTPFRQAAATVAAPHPP